MVRGERVAQLSNCPTCALSFTHFASVPTTQEANYGHQQELDMIPLMMQKDYSPKGWLGLILGTRLWYAIYAFTGLFGFVAVLFFNFSMIRMHFSD
jgi:hypothetical protein